MDFGCRTRVGASLDLMTETHDEPCETVSPVIKFVQVSTREVLERMVVELCILSIAKESFNSKIPVREQDAE